MEFVIMPLLALLMLYYVEIFTEVIFLIDVIHNCHYSLHRVCSNHCAHLMYTLKECKYDIRLIGKLDDDEDVYGERYRVYFYMPSVSKKVKIALADYCFYPEKPYKNRKEFILWQEEEECHELNCYDKLVKKIMKATIKRQLKKRSLELAKSTLA